MGPEVLYSLFDGGEPYLCALISFAKWHWIPTVMLFSVPQSVCNRVGHNFKADTVSKYNTSLVQPDCYCFLLSLYPSWKTINAVIDMKTVRLEFVKTIQSTTLHWVLVKNTFAFLISSISVPQFYWNRSPSKFAQGYPLEHGLHKIALKFDG